MSGALRIIEKSDPRIFASKGCDDLSALIRAAISDNKELKVRIVLSQDGCNRVVQGTTVVECRHQYREVRHGY